MDKITNIGIAANDVLSDIYKHRDYVKEINYNKRKIRLR